MNARVVLAAAEGIVKAIDRTLLFENGGHIKLSLDWAHSLLIRMGYVMRKATTEARTARRICCCQEMIPSTDQESIQRWQIPPEFVINWDQSGVNNVPSSQWEKGTTRVEIAGGGDKWQITVTVIGTLSGKLLPFQILYEAKTERWNPLTQFPEGFDIWRAPNHWTNGETSIHFMKQVIPPYISATQKDLALGEEHMAMVIFDTFKGNTGSEMESLPLENNVISVIVPNNCTEVHVLQPLDLSVNKPLKDHLRSKFQPWYSDQVLKQWTMENSQRTLK